MKRNMNANISDNTFLILGIYKRQVTVEKRWLRTNLNSEKQIHSFSGIPEWNVEGWEEKSVSKGGQLVLNDYDNRW